MFVQSKLKLLQMSMENQGFDYMTKKTPLRSLLKWCHVSESNQGHRDFQSPALPTELTWRET